MKIVLLDGYTVSPGDLSWEGLEKLGDVAIYDRTPENLIEERIGDAEIVITSKTPITESTILKHKNIKYIGLLSTGYNVVDVEAATKAGIPVCNVPSYGSDSVAQFAMALLLEVCNKVGEHSISVKAGDWAKCQDFCYWKSPLMELSGKTLGLIGFGNIGQRTAQMAAAFGMKIITSGSRPTEEGKKIGEYVSFDELLERSDVISLHCPLFKSTENIINKESIAKMKDGVVIINTSRGQLIDETALAEALVSGKVAYAAVDVVSCEPIKEDNPLLKAPNCIITPHIAWAPKESRKRLLDTVVENVEAFLKGEIQNKVN